MNNTERIDIIGFSILVHNPDTPMIPQRSRGVRDAVELRECNATLGCIDRGEGNRLTPRDGATPRVGGWRGRVELEHAQPPQHASPGAPSTPSPIKSAQNNTPIFWRPSQEVVAIWYPS